ncbi:MAG TPA: hypothetical protein PLA20_07050 [Bacilli bacterium]|jgi:DNA-3-methyladenine glycosylase II|nr:hypothetical protein [Bacilli bacterium]HON64422.1 hypothetical protein [Bacilli bacterium]HOR96604.1 hypothetical protein [Bacilli bacterium]HPD12559.1 hypothetical protein [Bacilli bacterium]HPK58810.1 hypothetical protein [Bacilli bacterium]
MPYFKYGLKEIAHLKARDSVLGAYIDSRGMIYRTVNPDLFSAWLNRLSANKSPAKPPKPFIGA